MQWTPTELPPHPEPSDERIVPNDSRMWEAWAEIADTMYTVPALVNFFIEALHLAPGGFLVSDLGMGYNVIGSEHLTEADAASTARYSRIVRDEFRRSHVGAAWEPWWLIRALASSLQAAVLHCGRTHGSQLLLHPGVCTWIRHFTYHITGLMQAVTEGASSDNDITSNDSDPDHIDRNDNDPPTYEPVRVPGMAGNQGTDMPMVAAIESEGHTLPDTPLVEWSPTTDME